MTGVQTCALPIYGPRPIRFSAHWCADYLKYRGLLAVGISTASSLLPFFWSIVYWVIYSKTVLEAFWTWPAGSIFTSEFRIKWFSVARFSGYFFLFIFFDRQFRLFSYSDSNTYLDTEISIISLRFGGLEITLVWFSLLFTRFPLCLHFTFLSLTMVRRAIFEIIFFLQAFKFAELKLRIHLKESQFFHIV